MTTLLDRGHDPFHCHAMSDHLTIEAVDFQAGCEELPDQLESGQLSRITVTQEGCAVAEVRPASNVQESVKTD